MNETERYAIYMYSIATAILCWCLYDSDIYISLCSLYDHVYIINVSVFLFRQYTLYLKLYHLVLLIIMSHRSNIMVYHDIKALKLPWYTIKLNHPNNGIVSKSL